MLPPLLLLLLISPAALRCAAPAAVTITDFATHARDAAEGWPPHSQPYLRSKGGGFGGPTLVAHQGVVLAFFAGHKYNCADSPGQQDILCRRSTTKGQNWTNCGKDLVVVDATKQGRAGCGGASTMCAVGGSSPVWDRVTGTITLAYTFGFGDVNDTARLVRSTDAGVCRRFSLRSTPQVQGEGSPGSPLSLPWAAGLSWSAPQLLVDSVAQRPAGWCQIVSSNNNGVQLASGRLIIPACVPAPPILLTTHTPHQTHQHRQHQPGEEESTEPWLTRQVSHSAGGFGAQLLAARGRRRVAALIHLG